MSVLVSEGLAKKYGRRQVVSDVSFEVDAGEIVGLLGPNGAGKTTSFRMTCGMVTPDRGTVTLGDKNVTNWPMHQRAREGGLGYLPQQSSVFGKLTVEQNLTATMQLLGMKAADRKRETERLLEEFQITKIRNTNAARVSGGERRRLEIARCLVSRPRIIMLDEPFAGIDPVTVQGIQRIIQRLAESGIGILITDHAAREILQITSRTYVISAGEVLCSGTASEVANHPEVREKYLGAIESITPQSAVSQSPASQVPTSQSHASVPAGPPTHPAPVSDKLPPAQGLVTAPFRPTPTTDSESFQSGPAQWTSPSATASSGRPVSPTRPVGDMPETSAIDPAGAHHAEDGRQAASESVRGTQVPRPNFRRRYFEPPQTIGQSREDRDGSGK